MLFKSAKKLQFSFFIFSIYSSQILAAACCGGTSTLPALITGDDKQILTISYAKAQIDTDVFSNGVWKKRPAGDITETYQIDSALIVKDLYQVGFSIPVQTRSRSGALGGQSSGLADVSLQLGYEFLPDWDYNPYRPHGVGFLTFTLPTGVSIYESTQENALDSRGRGFWALGSGVALNKSWAQFDANFIFELHKAFAKEVKNSQLNARIEPDFGGSVTLGSGYNFKDFRFGGSLAWSYEDPINVSGANSTSTGSLQKFATGSLVVNYLYSSEFSTSLSYADQTLFGDPSNSALSKTISLNLQKRWPR
jgi:hypothetical protein